jgi:hydroxymethylpyrimidine kinase/phosphomethylpyrimidine kinase
MKKEIVLSIAGSDSGAGAGIQADIKSIHANGAYAITVITAITSQNTTGVKSIYQLPLDVIESQFRAVMEDFDVKVIKIGMLGSYELIDLVDRLLKSTKAKVVFDPIISSSSKERFIKRGDLQFLKESILKRAYLTTPNVEEIELLTNIDVIDELSAKKACEKLGHNILLTGIEQSSDKLLDLLFLDGEFYRFDHKKIESKNTHGTGCTLSSAISAYLAQGYDLKSSCQKAIDYQLYAIENSYDTGRGSGSLNHFFMMDIVNG